MTTDTPTYIPATSGPGRPLHLSADGRFTLCGWRISDHWQRHNERVALFTLWLSGVRLCGQCEREAERERAAAAATE